MVTKETMVMSGNQATTRINFYYNNKKEFYEFHKALFFGQLFQSEIQLKKFTNEHHQKYYSYFKKNDQH